MQKKRLIHRIEEVILVLIILLSILDFFEVLPADLDFVKKIISWTALGYLLCKASLSNVFFKSKNRYVDVLLVVSYFMLIFKNVIAFSSGVIDEFVVFYGFQSFILENSSSLELFSFSAGSIMILLLAVYSSFCIKVRKPSLMDAISLNRKPMSLYRHLIRIIPVYFVYIGFFVVVFNLVMEWLAISIDAPLIMIGSLFYLFVVVRHHKKYHVESLIYKIGEFGENFYKNFISLFHHKKTIFLGISGMLVLHLLTDALSFILPYALNFKDTLYFSQFGPYHSSLISIFLEQIRTETLIEQFSLFFIYILNVAGILFLLLIPSVLWYIAFKGRRIYLNKLTISLIYSSVLALVISPVFYLGRLRNNAILGVDIRTGFASNFLFSSFFQALFLIFAVFAAVYFLLDYHKKYFLHIIMLKSTVFFGYYVYLFFTSLLVYYVDTIRVLFNVSRFALSFYFLLFLAINMLFYVVGFVIFIDEAIKEKVYRKLL